MRLFVGISLPDDLVARLSTFVDVLRPLAPLRWSRIADLHLTTKFIGEQPRERVADFERELGTLTARAPLHLAIRGVGFFPDSRAPRVFWAGVDAEALTKLVMDTERVLIPLGVAAESRPFAPHLTLARVPPRTRLEALHQKLSSLESTDFGAFTADQFTLYESRSGDGHQHYRSIATFPLTG